MAEYWTVKNGDLVPAQPGDPVSMVTNMDFTSPVVDWGPVADGPIVIFEGDATDEKREAIKDYILSQLTTKEPR